MRIAIPSTYLISDVIVSAAIAVAPQVVAGQLEGTLFDVQAAQRKAQQLRQGTYRHPTADNKLSARDVAQAARAASRSLQALPSQVLANPISCSQSIVECHVATAGHAGIQTLDNPVYFW